MLLAWLMPFLALAQFKENIHYKVISYDNSKPVAKVTEYFSYLCPHCYNFEKNYIPKLSLSLEKNNVKFEQSHVDFIGGQLGKEMSRAHAISYQMSLDKGIKMKLFEAVNRDKQSLLEKNGIKKLFIAHGVDEKDYESNEQSFLVNSKISQMNYNAKKSKITGVPAFVVNQKYLVINNSVKSYDELTNLILYLSKKDK